MVCGAANRLRLPEDLRSGLDRAQRLLFRSVCTGMLVLYVWRSLEEHYVDRPTATTVAHVGLDDIDFPDVNACVQPAFPYPRLVRFGYFGALNYYFGGFFAPIGWSGSRGNVSAERVYNESVFALDQAQLVRRFEMNLMDENGSTGTV